MFSYYIKIKDKIKFLIQYILFYIILNLYIFYFLINFRTSKFYDVKESFSHFNKFRSDSDLASNQSDQIWFV